jgi:hypothetical protein
MFHTCKGKIERGYMPIREMVMTAYTVEKVKDGIATVRYADNSWAEIIVTEGMTQEDFDDQAYQFRPKTGVSELPSFISVGASRTAAEKPEPEATDAATPQPQWLLDRLGAYGNVQTQIEFITENGLEAWQAEVASIKSLYPKTTEE